MITVYNPEFFVVTQKPCERLAKEGKEVPMETFYQVEKSIEKPDSEVKRPDNWATFFSVLDWPTSDKVDPAKAVRVLSVYGHHNTNNRYRVRASTAMVMNPSPDHDANVILMAIPYRGMFGQLELPEGIKLIASRLIHPAAPIEVHKQSVTRTWPRIAYLALLIDPICTEAEFTVVYNTRSYNYGVATGNVDSTSIKYTWKDGALTEEKSIITSIPDPGKFDTPLKVTELPERPPRPKREPRPNNGQNGDRPRYNDRQKPNTYKAGGPRGNNNNFNGRHRAG